jgi:hypothetical protein
MKLTYLISLCSIVLSSSICQSQQFKPYILGAESFDSVTEIKEKVKGLITAQGFDILGEYAPAKDKTRWVIIVSNNDMIDAIKRVGGLTGFAAALRIGITREGDKTLISYTNPEYWANAYFRENYSQVKALYDNVDKKFKNVVRQSGKYIGSEFGSDDGMDADDLHSYHYMFGMPRFDDTVELAEFSSFSEAQQTIRKNLKSGVKDVNMIYSIKIPGKELELYGFELTGEDGEQDFLPTIDISEPKHTAFLPYEFLIMGNQVHMLHGRYRIALSFPDLTMGTFTKIMSTPGNIKGLLKSVTIK